MTSSSRDGHLRPVHDAASRFLFDAAWQKLN
jgi:hypothetical protein